jgi:hypothetical protein
MSCVLRLAISLLLVFCTPPAVDQCAKSTALSLEQGSTMTYSAQVITEPAVVSIDLAQRINHKSSDNAFQIFVVPLQISVLSRTHLAFIPFYIIDRFANIIGLKATALRAPPSL